MSENTEYETLKAERNAALNTCTLIAEALGITGAVAGETIARAQQLIAQLEAAQKLISEDGKLQYIRRLEARVEKAETALSAANEKLSTPVVLPAATYVRIGYDSTAKRTLYLDEVIAAIKAAGFTVEGE
ncbi:hypothetical protein NFB71_09110 [Yersinia ruckeri]|uniref:hypothetical protein n=1 Tax=Yersinia ruckeri TaxID=29486 RepID=UPI001F1FE853|nr:hypothetical protein [Yersinia ruckeri]MCW6523040.1 hypothetical protein [Yersinia ruckeri]MCW6594204.1 hypothetical protein [Yersinia ruckeri]MCW6603569.1 hypothetical protein [Yersinia ruckeri]UIN14943.1 hypothetical protein LGL85_04820 [Yersinia ruckeri]UIN18321.1 hypothetical protein LGL86_04805 [Yersinia ruckeri]